ncbi:MAG: hypothetical protein AUK27_04725 [Deltaproteobacteria bacterium CG2_30_66_27]|nr:MAG: hypothetical protein AUK27_04725 [Deltaproteobacteria bacterium CG2_30_66_27]PJB32555.1 MAG: hypothetical protein CO109_04035 [Deltaproteobacteria bacterium CG_4_9_14_3_um_filter_65_9]
MGSILSLVVPALIPAVADGLRGIFSRLTGGAGAKPQNVEEQIKLTTAENERLKALAELDKPSENISPWVADLRASFRYVAGGLIILGAVSTLYLPADLLVQDAIWNLAGSVFAFLFGDRMYFKFAKR